MHVYCVALVLAPRHIRQYVEVPKLRTPCSHAPLRRLATNRYEISGLTIYTYGYDASTGSRKMYESKNHTSSDVLSIPLEKEEETLNKMRDRCTQKRRWFARAGIY